MTKNISNNTQIGSSEIYGSTANQQETDLQIPLVHTPSQN